MSEALHRDYQIGQAIGRGRFGTVFSSVHRSSGDRFAVKSVDKSLLSDPLDRDLIDREAKIHQLAAFGANPWVVQIHDVYEDADSLHLVLDLCDGPDLFDRISVLRGAPVPEPEAAAAMSQLMQGVAECHRRGVAHRDIKPDNLLFDSWGRLRLADFGSAECFVGPDGGEVPMTGVVGTPYYVAPEVVAGREYGKKVDVWSAGVVVYMLLSGGVPPFCGETPEEIFEAVLRANLLFPKRVFGSVSSAAKDLMRRMLCKDDSRRFTAEQVLRHPWITSGGQA